MEQITMVTLEGTQLTAPITLRHMSKFIDTILEDAGASEEIPLTNISTKCLSTILEFCAYHKYENPGYEIPRPLPSADISAVVPAEWSDDVTLINGLETETVCELINACNFLDIKCLLDLSLARIASMFIGKS
jgi:S-phase kinase-associated protein 1